MKNLLIPVILWLQVVTLSANPDSTWFVNNYTKIERYIPMRDGIRLFTSIYLPKDATEKHPVLMTRTPYSCQPYGADFFPYWNSYAMAYLKEGYIMVTQDVRGRWMSEGEFVDVRPFKPVKRTKRDIDESSDTWDTIDWLIRNIAENNGKVGVYGISYPGFFSTMAAASNHPALVAVSPQAPVTNWFIGDDFHHNGAFFLLDAFSFYTALGSGFGLPHPKPVSEGPRTIEPEIHDSYKFYLGVGTLKDFARLAGDSVKFWKDLYAHPTYDDFWKARDARNATKDLKPAMLWVGGLFDAEDNWGAWNSYMAAEKNNPGKEFNRLVMGPWYHVQWANNDGTHLGNVQFGSNTSQWYQQNMEIPFFNYFLKGEGNVSDIAEANIFITGANEWKKFDQWPPAASSAKSLYLGSGGMLGWTAPGVGEASTEYTSDPAKPVPYTEDVHYNRTRNYMTDDQRFAGRRPDVITFRTPVLDKDVTLAGLVTADLTVSISTTDADLIVKLIDGFPDSLSYNATNNYVDAEPALPYPMGGYEMLVHGEVFRGRYRNSYEFPEAFVPGTPAKVRFNIGDVAHTFQKGHCIIVQIQSTWFPLVDRNPQQFVNIYEASAADFVKSVIRIHHDQDHPSCLILPVLSR